MVAKMEGLEKTWTKIILLCLSALSVVWGQGEFIVTHSPSHVTFRQDAQKILNSEVSSVISSTFGFTVNKEMVWDGLGQNNLFARPKANVVVSVEGVPRSLNIKNHRRYQAQNDDPTVNTGSVINHLQTNLASTALIVDFSTDNSLFELRGQHPELFSKLPATLPQLKNVFASGMSGFAPVDMGVLNATEEADLLFLGELHVISGIMNAVKMNPELLQDNTPDFFHLRVQGVQRLAEQYGKTSQQVKDAMNLLEKLLDEVTSEFRRLYSDNLVIQVITTPTAEKPSTHSRRARSLLQDPPKPELITTREEELGVSKIYSDMYPVVFNIMLWGGIAFVLTVYAISYGIWVMDPGKDSIIYRMTSQRMKKD